MVEIAAEYILGLIAAGILYLNARMECMRRKQNKHLKLAWEAHPDLAKKLDL